MATIPRRKRLGPRRRAPPMTPERVNDIVALIHAWEGRLTWEALCEVIERETKARYTRQALNRYVDIKVAYGAYRDNPTVRNEKKLSESAERIQKLERRIAELEAVRTLLLEKFARWAYNASTRNLDEVFLDQPLVRINRAKNH